MVLNLENNKNSRMVVSGDWIIQYDSEQVSIYDRMGRLNKKMLMKVNRVRIGFNGDLIIL